MALGFFWVALILGVATEAEAYSSPWGTGISEPEDLVISIATFSPGDSVESWFGHSGIIVEDRRHNIGRLYNYGMFNFDRDMLVRFAMGRLWFWVAPTSIAGTYRMYMSMDRDIRVKELNIPPEKRLEVAQFLADNVRPENREYLYHHYDDNCSTRLRDIIDIAVDGQFSAALGDKPGRYTLREHTRRHSSHFPPMDWVLMYLMNGEIDGPSTVWEEMFLPEELERQILKFDWVDDEGKSHPLVLRTHEVYTAENREPVPQSPRNHWMYWLLFGVVVGGVGLGIGYRGRHKPGRSSRILYGFYLGGIGFLVGFPGLVLGVMALFTEHTVTYWNQNLFWASPLTFLLLPLSLGVLLGKERAKRSVVQLVTLLSAVAALGIVFQLISLFAPAIYQDTTIPLVSVVPILVGLTAAAWLIDGNLVRREK